MITVHENKVIIEYIIDWYADTSYLEQEGFEVRLKAFQRGSFGFVGVIAKCQIVVHNVLQTITSSGLWGIESDSNHAYFADIVKDELSSLKIMLSEFGISEKVISELDISDNGPDSSEFVAREWF